MRGMVIARWFRQILIPPMMVAAAAILLGYPLLPDYPVAYAAQGIQGYPPRPGPVLPGAPGTPPITVPITNIGGPPPLTRRQKDAILTQSFKKTKSDVAKLAKLVQALQKEVDKSNANVLSLRIIKQANNIEKLAHKIKNESKMY